jgi:prolyl oligopeptidase
MKVYYHRIGTPQAADELVFEDKLNPLRNFYAGTTEDERYVVISVSEGTGSKNALMYRDLSKPGNKEFLPLIANYENMYSVIDNMGDRMLVMTNKDAPRNKVVLIDPRNPEPDKWVTVLPQKDEVLENVTLVGGKMIAVYMKSASHKVYICDYSGKVENEIKLPTYGTVSGFGGKRNDTETFYTFTSFTYPQAIYHYEVSENKNTLFKKSELNFDMEGYETKQVEFTSKDGTKVPMFIVHRKGLELNGKNPVMLYGYGGFNISLNPNFSLSRLILLENGGVFAMPNLRGGGEFGEEWHTGGTLLNKQNVFNDFIAAAEYLIDQKYTSPEKLCISGGSNGGLLVGACMTQRPDLFRVALPAVGVLDMLRYHKFTIGYAWEEDYGTSADEANFKNLLKYSPLHNLKAGASYPATLVTTADHDDRVVPAHSFKFIATLQEKNKGDNPVLIRIETQAGHGAGKPTAKLIEEAADIYSFMFYNLGITPKE